MNPTLDSAPGGFLAFTDDGTVQTINQTLLDLLDRSRDAVEGHSIENLFSPGAKLFYNTHLFPLLQMQGRIEEVYLSFQTGTDDTVQCLLNADRTTRDGAPINEILCLRFEERNEYEEEILRAKQAAEEANRAKDKFLSTVSHELRTPISTIKSLTQYLSMGVRGPVTDDQKDYLQRIEGAADYLDRLINDILDFARLETGSIETTLQTVHLGQAFQRVESLLEVRFQKARLAYERALASSDLQVRADPDRLQQILLNLLTNAIKFTPEGGTVSLTADADEEEVHIRVQDTGVGIDADEQSHIFDPFSQAHDKSASNAENGIGLGLAISNDLAEAMNGTLTVDSSPEQGSTFTLTLPTTSA